MVNHVSKIGFKAKALEPFRRIEETGEPVVITDHGSPQPETRAVSSTPDRGETADEIFAFLRGATTYTDDSLEPVGLDDWEALK